MISENHVPDENIQLHFTFSKQEEASGLFVEKYS